MVVFGPLNDEGLDDVATFLEQATAITLCGPCP